ncbi:MAG: hypothetical protein AB8B93_20335 [Pseudomonadales bacterium]
MTLLILQMLGLLILASLLGWLIGRWKVTTLLAERDELHEMRMRSRFKKMEELKQSLSAQPDQSVVDLEVHRMLEDRFHQLKQDHNRAQQLLQESEQKLGRTKNQLQQREQDLREADQSLSKRDLELSTLQSKDLEAQALLTQVNSGASAELATAQSELDTVRSQLALVEQEREEALARVQEFEGQVVELRAAAELDQSKLRESVEQTQRNAQVATDLQVELEALKERTQTAEQATAAEIAQLQAQDKSASLDAAVADAARWREAHDVAHGKAARIEAQLTEADQRAADGELRIAELERMIGDLQGVQAQSDQAQSETLALRDEMALLGAAKDKSERNADVLKQVYFRMRDRFRDADARAQQLDAVSREQAASVADDSATAMRLRREKRELEERLEKTEAVAGKLRAEFNKRFLLTARLQETLKGQQEQLSSAQNAIAQYEKSETLAKTALNNRARNQQEQVQAADAAEQVISVLKSTVSKQRDRLALCREGIEEMQQLLNADSSQVQRLRSQRPTSGLPKEAANNPDNLQRIKGIGWRKEARLRSLGIERFADMARLSSDDVLWLDQVMGLDGAVQRQDWVGQSRKLAAVAGRAKGPARSRAAGTKTSLDQPIKRVAEPKSGGQ